VTAEASAYANSAPPQISKREHEFSSLQIEHTINPHLPLDGTGDINYVQIRCGRAPLVPRMLCDCNGDFLATDEGSTTNSPLIRTMLTQAAIPRTMTLRRIWTSHAICEDFREDRSTVFFPDSDFAPRPCKGCDTTLWQ
jgi:hypothetical protein